MSVPKHDPTVISTFADLIQARCRLSGFCLTCGHCEREIDLTKYPQHGKYWGRTWRCICGAKAEIRLHPPVTYFGGKTTDNV